MHSGNYKEEDSAWDRHEYDLKHRSCRSDTGLYQDLPGASKTTENRLVYGKGKYVRETLRFTTRRS